MIIHTQICRKSNCKKKFRARSTHELCRTHYREVNGESRPIASRDLSENKYRRTRARRKVSSKPTTAVAGKSKKGKK